MIAMAEALPRKELAWCASIGQLVLLGTRWKGGDSDRDKLEMLFKPKGVLRYSDGDGTYENGRWFQVGNALSFETNHHYAHYTGAFIGTSMRGIAANVVRHQWTWRVNFSA
jgi:hypothetical protein